MKHQIFIIKEKVFMYPSEISSWYFLPVDKKMSEVIRKQYSSHARSFGSLPVEATIGNTTWRTSIFPYTYTKGYILPLKAMVRKKENIKAGDRLTCYLTLGVSVK